MRKDRIVELVRQRGLDWAVVEVREYGGWVEVVTRGLGYTNVASYGDGESPEMIVEYCNMLVLRAMSCGRCGNSGTVENFFEIHECQ